MTFFGEILPVVSRAVDEDEKPNLVPEIVWKSLFSYNSLDKDVDLLIVAVGGHACDFIESYASYDSDLLGSFFEQIQLFSTDTLQVKEFGKVYVKSINDKTVVTCVLHKNCCPENSWDLSNLIQNLTQGQIIKTLVFESKPRSSYQDEMDYKSNVESLKKVLYTTSYNTSKECSNANLSSCLEQPNVLGELSAAIITDCEIRNVSCKVCLCYSDGWNKELFEDLLNYDLHFMFNKKLMVSEISTKHNSFSQLLYV